MQACLLSDEQTCFLPLPCYTLPNWLTLIPPRIVPIAIEALPFDFYKDVLVIQTSLGFLFLRQHWVLSLADVGCGLHWVPC